MGQQYAFKHAHVIRHVCMLLFLLPFMMGCEEDKEPSVYSGQRIFLVGKLSFKRIA